MPLRHSGPRSAALIALIALSVLGGCVSESKRPTGPLPPEDARLVRETLDLIRVQVERAESPQRAAALRDSLGPHLLRPDQLEALLARAGSDPVRAERIATAVHESLQARRERWFPPSASEGPAVPRVDR